MAQDAASAVPSLTMRLWGASLLWAGADIRRRWRSLIVLGLLAGLTAGLAMAAFAGARRTDTALGRLDRATHAPDAVVFPSQVDDIHPKWAGLAARPEVAQLSVWDLFFCTIEGQEGGLLFASGGDGWLTRIDKPVVLAGQMSTQRQTTRWWSTSKSPLRTVSAWARLSISRPTPWTNPTPRAPPMGRR